MWRPWAQLKLDRRLGRGGKWNGATSFFNYIYINKKNTAHGCKFSSSSLFPELMHWRPTTKNEIWSRPKCQQGPDDYVCTCLGGSISKCSPKSKRSRCLATFLGYFLRNGIYIYINIYRYIPWLYLGPPCMDAWNITASPNLMHAWTLLAFTIYKAHRSFRDVDVGTNAHAC